tara:strand:- start:171 stop:326 length:156 start_codon:yes stop_codon:yes gene_type:complete
MTFLQNDFLENEQEDAIDSYFECVTACSIDEQGSECVTRCMEVHLKADIDS